MQCINLGSIRGSIILNNKLQVHCGALVKYLARTSEFAGSNLEDCLFLTAVFFSIHWHHYTELTFNYIKLIVCKCKSSNKEMISDFILIDLFKCLRFLLQSLVLYIIMIRVVISTIIYIQIDIAHYLFRFPINSLLIGIQFPICFKSSFCFFVGCYGGKIFLISWHDISSLNIKITITTNNTASKEKLPCFRVSLSLIDE